MAQVEHGHGYHRDRVVQQAHAAVGEARDDLGIEDHVAAGKRRVRHPFLDHLDIVGKACRAPHVGDRVAVSWIGLCQQVEDPGVEVREVRELTFVQRLVNPDRYQTCRESGAMDHNVVAGVASHELRIDDLR